MRRDRRLALGVLVVVALVGAWAAWGLRVETEITHFLPAADDRELAEISSELASSELTRTLTLTLEAPTTERAAEAATAMAEALAEAEPVSWVSAGPDADLQQAFYEAYFPRRLGLHEEATFDGEAIAARIHRLQRLLASPTGAFVRRLAPEDPWLLFLDRVEGLREGQRGGLAVREGAYVAGPDQRYGVVLLASHASPFDAAASRALQDAIGDAFETVNGPGDLTLEQASIHRIALRSEASIRGDIQRVSTLGTLGVVLLVLLFFRRPRYLLLSALPLAGGFAIGLAVTRSIFGSIHGLTLAFGATLIGVSLDYVAHLVSHHVLDPPQPAAEGRAGWRTLRRIAPGLVLGAATTMAGLVGLAWTSFPGIRQMAVFTTAGVAAALALTMVCLPPFLPEDPKPTRVHARVGEAMKRLLDRLADRRALLLVLPAVALGLTAAIPLLEWQDDLRELSPVDADLRAEDERVRDRVARMDAGRLVVSRGGTLQEALERNDAVAEALDAATAAGELEGFRSLSDLLPSAATQRARRAAIGPDAWGLTLEALRAEGFVEEPFAPFREALEAPFEPLLAEDLPPALARLAGAQQIALDDGVAVLTFVHGVAEPEALAARVDAIEGVRFFDQAEFIASAYRELRRRTLQLVGVGLLAVLLLVFLRYRRLGPTLAAFLPALLAAGATLGLLGLLGIEATLLHVVALLLVLSMGVDYGVFMVEAEAHDSGPATAVSLLIACLSTMASFGILAASTNPALSAMGLTAAVGVIASLLLAPTAWLLLVRRHGGADQPPGASGPQTSAAPTSPGPTSSSDS